MRSTLVVGLMVLAVSACETRKEPAKKPDPKPAATPTPAPAPVPTPDVNLGDRQPELPDDLQKLAEMPALTAEATPEEIDRRLARSLDALSAFLEILSEHRDCDALGTALGRFVEVNKKLLTNLEAASKNNPALTAKFEQMIRARGTQWLSKLADNLQKCMSHPKVVGALMDLSKTQE